MSYVQLTNGTIQLDQEVDGISYSVNSAPQPAPIINGHTGSVAQSSTVTLDGSFSALRNGQLLYFTGNPALNNTCATEFVPINGSALNPSDPDCYFHSTEQSFSGSGASIKFTKAAANSVEGPHNSKFVLPSRKKELYVSYNSRLTMNDWSSQSGGQIKMVRFSTINNTHSSDPIMGHIEQRYGVQSTAEFVSTLPSYTPLRHVSNNATAYVEETFNKWVRNEMWAKLPDYPTKSQAVSYFWAERLIYQDADKLRLNNAPAQIELLPELPIVNWEHTWQEYTFDKVILPFYVRNWMDCVIYVDGLFINDSPERVELGNAPVLHNCTKKIVQEQLSRNTSEIQFKVSMGNFVNSDDIYAFVVNKDGKYSDGYLIRSAS